MNDLRCLLLALLTVVIIGLLVLGLAGDVGAESEHCAYLPLVMTGGPYCGGIEHPRPTVVPVRPTAAGEARVLEIE